MEDIKTKMHSTYYNMLTCYLHFEMSSSWKTWTCSPRWLKCQLHCRLIAFSPLIRVTELFFKACEAMTPANMTSVEKKKTIDWIHCSFFLCWRHHMEILSQLWLNTPETEKKQLFQVERLTSATGLNYLSHRASTESLTNEKNDQNQNENAFIVIAIDRVGTRVYALRRQNGRLAVFRTRSLRCSISAAARHSSQVTRTPANADATAGECRPPLTPLMRTLHLKVQRIVRCRRCLQQLADTISSLFSWLINLKFVPF